MGFELGSPPFIYLFICMLARPFFGPLSRLRLVRNAAPMTGYALFPPVVIQPNSAVTLIKGKKGKSKIRQL